MAVKKNSPYQNLLLSYTGSNYLKFERQKEDGLVADQKNSFYYATQAQVSYKKHKLAAADTFISIFGALMNSLDRGQIPHRKREDRRK